MSCIGILSLEQTVSSCIMPYFTVWLWEFLFRNFVPDHWTFLQARAPWLIRSWEFDWIFSCSWEILGEVSESKSNSWSWHECTNLLWNFFFSPSLSYFIANFFLIYRMNSLSSFSSNDLDPEQVGWVTLGLFSALELSSIGGETDDWGVTCDSELIGDFNTDIPSCDETLIAICSCLISSLFSFAISSAFSLSLRSSFAHSLP